MNIEHKTAQRIAYKNFVAAEQELKAKFKRIDYKVNDKEELEITGRSASGNIKKTITIDASDVKYLAELIA